jgi:hypothetical protein
LKQGNRQEAARAAVHEWARAGVWLGNFNPLKTKAFRRSNLLELARD